MFPGNSKKLEAICHQRTEPWHAAQKIHQLLTLRASPQCTFIGGKKEAGSSSPGGYPAQAKKWNGCMAIVKGCLDYICLDMFIYCIIYYHL